MSKGEMCLVEHISLVQCNVDHRVRHPVYSA
jgi:hypothetical protein